MKKLFLLLTMAVSAISSFAQDSDLTKYINDTYNGYVVVTINGESTEPLPADVTIGKQDGNIINFTLKNFILRSDGEEIGVGNINVTGIQLQSSAKPNTTVFENKQTIFIDAGDAEGVDFWMGPELPEIPVELRGEASGDNIDIDIEIDMVETLEQMIHVDFYAGDPTGITNINVDKKINNNIYNVIGQKVAASAKGLKVVNGRKFINVK